MRNDVGLFFGSTTGATEGIAEKIVEKAVEYGFDMTAVDVISVKKSIR